MIPDTEQCKDDRHVLLKRGAHEMAIHLMRAIEKLRKLLFTDGDHDRQADCRPERKTPADPVPEDEHVVGVDAERTDSLAVGRDGNEMPRNLRLVSAVRQEPFTRRCSVGHRLLGREGFRGDNEERCPWIERLQGLLGGDTVDIGEEVQPQIRLHVGFKGFADHLRTQIRPADTDVHHVSDSLAGEATPFT